MAVTKDGRGFVAGKYAIELDGIMAGWVYSVEGGHATADVVQEKTGAQHRVHKHIAGVKYEDITISCGTGMSNGFYKWIDDTVQMKYSRKNGAIIAADYDHSEHSRLTWIHGLMVEFGMPALDAASKDAAKMTIKLKPEITRNTTTTGGAKIAGGKYAMKPDIQKKWLPANFRLKIDGMDDACSKVNKIEALVVKQKVVEHAVGEMRDYEQEPASIEIPNLVITFPESHSKSFYTWHENFVIKGMNGQNAEKGGTLDYLTPDLKTTLFTLTFENLGIFKLTPEKVEGGNEAIRRLKAEMYCEHIKFEYKGATWA